MRTNTFAACAAAVLALSECYAKQLSVTDLRVLSAGTLVTMGNPYDISPDVVVAFALKESSGFNKAPYQDGKSKAWGLFGYHEARWCDHGGTKAEWGRASEARQFQVFINGLNKYLRNADVHHAKNRLTWIATAHNSGTGSDVPTEYVKQLTDILQQLGKE